ncbi:MAG: helix-hairpin-helix domain-containing protein [Bordetella sp.]|nr:helix-hairpin-helix domain-containing protein [Pseudomonadota bacterium]
MARRDRRASSTNTQGVIMFKKVLASLAFAAMSMAASAAVEINKGSVADFDGLPGVGPALSRRIVDARQQAEFKDWPDFMARVKGVKQKSAAKLSAAGLTVNGKSFDKAAEGSAAKKSTAARKSSAR